METILLKNQNIESLIDQATKLIKAGSVVVTPSETQYGLSADPTNHTAVAKLLVIKNRPAGMSLGLVAGSYELVEKFFLLNNKEKAIAAKFWPGPLGLELSPRQDNDLVQTILKNTLGENYDSTQPQLNKKVIRVTSDKLLAGISNSLGLPIISTSANISGQPPCYDLDCVKEQFKNSQPQPDLLIDAGRLKPNQPSTMIDLSGANPCFIRRGANSKAIDEFLKSIVE